MALSRCRLGDLLEFSVGKNADLKYGLGDVRGISIQKTFIETKADMGGVSLHPYLLVKPNDFAYITVTSRNGEKITLAHNDADETYIVSSSYVVFRVRHEEKLLSDYLFMYFNRPEFDRYARFNSWGSARETFSWSEMCDIDILLPPLPVQRKYVNIYNALRSNQRAYERGLDDLKLTCDGYIENLRRTTKCEEVGKYIRRSKEINSDLSVKKVVGLFGDIFKRAKRTSGQEDFARYQIIKKGQIVYPPPHFGEIGTIGLYNGDEDALVSPMYITVESTDRSKILPEYMILWFRREEFKRYAFFAACTSIRDTFDYEMLCEYKIPVPPIDVQQAVANIYGTYMRRREINERLKTQLQSICPILIRGSIEEA